LLLAAAVGSRATRVQTVALGDAAIFRTRDPFGHQWQFVSQGVSTLQRENYASLTVSLMTEVEGRRLGMFSAEARSYVVGDGAAPGSTAFVSGKISRPFLETRLTVIEPEGKQPTLRIAFVPLAPWVVVGAWLVVIGTLVPLFPV